MILIEKIYRYSWSYDAHYRFFCVHNSCHQLMGYDGVENRGLYLNCVWDCSVDYDTSRPYGFSIPATALRFLMIAPHGTNSPFMTTMRRLGKKTAGS